MGGERKIEIGKSIYYKDIKMKGLNANVNYIPSNFALYNGMHVLTSQYTIKASGNLVIQGKNWNIPKEPLLRINLVNIA